MVVDKVEIALEVEEVDTVVGGLLSVRTYVLISVAK